MAELREVFVVDGARTPFLRSKEISPLFTASDLAVHAGRELFKRLPVTPDMVNEVVVGCVIPGVDETNIARVISLRLGCGKFVPAWSVHRNCASGMQALDCGWKDIAIGRREMVLAGGTEAMSHAPLFYNRSFMDFLSRLRRAKVMAEKLSVISSFRPSMLNPVIGIIHGLTDPVAGVSMGQTAENIAKRFDISRAEMDGFSLESHKKLAAEQDGNNFAGELAPIIDRYGNLHEADDGLRRDGTLEKLGRLKPVFDKPAGKVTAGNSSQITDGAAMLLLASADAVKKHKLPIIGKIITAEWAGLEPEQMGLGPVYAMSKLLDRLSLKSDDIDMWEINEAFSAQMIGCLRAWNEGFLKTEVGIKTYLGDIDEAKLNLDGGGIAMGHPVGASGARIVLHLLKRMERSGGKRGIASLCIGGGQGGAMLVERV